MKNENEQIKIYTNFKETSYYQNYYQKITFIGIYFYFFDIYINSSYNLLLMYESAQKSES